MKRIVAGITLGVAVIMLTLPAVQAQEETWLELLRADLRADKTAIVTVAMGLSDDEGTIFWPIYRDYEVAVSSINDRRSWGHEAWSSGSASARHRSAVRTSGTPMERDPRTGSGGLIAENSRGQYAWT